MKIELVVFDMAGTTVRDDDAVHHCLAEALAADHVKVTRDEVNEVMGIAKPLAIGTLLQRHAPETQDINARVQKIHNHFLDRMIHHYQTSPAVEPMPHTLETFAKLKEAGIYVALDTGFSRPILNAILDRLDWRESPLLDATVASDEVANGRPHPDLLFRAMELTGIKTAQQVAKVGDTPSDLREGANAGCGLVIGVTNGSHTQEQLRLHPHSYLIPSLQELPGLVLRNGKS